MALRTISFITLAVVIISCASSLPPAEPSEQMMVQADKVILTIDKDPELAFNDIKNHLLDKGFAIQKANPQALTMQTGYRKYGATVFGILGGYSMRIIASVDDSTITFYGRLNTGTKVQNDGGKTSPVKNGWNQIVKIAKDFPHKDIYYSRNQ